MDDVLLTKYLLKETSEAEAQVVRSWLADHPDNGRYYARLQLIWDASRSFAAESKVDEQAAWERFVQRRRAGDGARRNAAKPLIRKMGWLRVAAAAVLVSIAAFAGYYLIGYDRVAGPLLGALHETNDAVSTDTLADGSVITLSKHASLRFSQGLFQRKRVVELHSGSVFFEVKPDRDKPFVIQSGEVTVTVLGTSFHVTRNGDETAVIVASGKVQVSGLNKAVELEARQKVTINTATQRFEENRVIGVLDHTPLWQIVAMLEDTYNVEITIANDAIRDLPMTTTLHRGTLDETLHVIAETLGITATREDNQIVFKK
ncbi:FecR domain-containing protein [Parapedobacter pyrenivorans]|uniref:FecR domain-containing protein n=1 Tax=Parapedobacter pyrenivorans TaxID=1305674 RepID=UPI003341DF4F